jgi:purine catabolism regulator
VAPTVRDVLGVRGLALRLLAGGDGVDRPIRWVHATELADPAPFLEGGEMILTTGMRLGKAAPSLKAFADRLVAADVVALGFGTGEGLSHQVVPKALITACDKAGLPLLEVPEGTPFIQVTKVVSDLIAAEEREQLARSLEAQRALTRAALGQDRAAGVVARLAREIGGWALLVGVRGEILAASPGHAKERIADVLPEIERLRPKGMHAGSSSSADGERIAVQPLGVQGRPRGYLAVGAPEPWAPAWNGTVNIAVSLLSLEGERGVDDDDAARALRSAAASLIADGFADRVPVAALGWAALREAPLDVLVARGGERAVVDAWDRVEEEVPSALAVRMDDDLVVAVRSGNGDEDAVMAALLADRAVAVGRAPAEGLAGLGESLRRARQAVASARGAVGAVHDYGALAGVGLLDLVDADAAAGFSDAVLAPLDASPAAADLLASLDAWLGRHGQWDAAAQELGVHRHTLRHRIRRIEQMLDRSLDDPAVRMELWFALRRRDDRP